MRENLEKSQGLFVGLGLLTIMGLGLYAITTKQESSRPPGSDPVPSLGMRTGLPARLWSDPYGPALSHFNRNRDKLPDLLKPGLTEDSHTLFGAPLGFPYEQIEQGKSYEEVLLLAVSIPVSGFSEDIEDRIRTRYAVVSGLNRTGFEPLDSDHLSYRFFVPDEQMLVFCLAPVGNGVGHV